MYHYRPYCIGATLRSVLLDLMNTGTDHNAPVPDEWRRSVMSVLHKSGDQKLAKNYRPVCILPLLYKLLSTLLYARLAPTLDDALCKDQAGFRPKYSTLDHMHAFSLIQEKSSEFQIPIWIACIDFQKAFGSVEHVQYWEH